MEYIIPEKPIVAPTPQPYEQKGLGTRPAVPNKIDPPKK